MAFELVQRSQDATSHYMPPFQWQTKLGRKHGLAQKGHQVKQSVTRGTLHKAGNENF